MARNEFEITDEARKKAEEQIINKQRDTDFDIREYPVEVIVNKFLEKIKDDQAELFIPDYQRELVWLAVQQSRFIESILLNLPIPYLYVADVIGGENDGRLEIVDGSQRIRTLARFFKDELRLSGLELLDALNGFCFSDLPLSRQLRFKRKTLRMIELIGIDEDSRRQIFDRLNSGGMNLNSMEKRRGSRDGRFIEFIKVLADDERFIRLCPISQTRVKHRDYEEMVIRFFAYGDRYKEFDKSVDEFLNSYVEDMNSLDFCQKLYKKRFDDVMLFVEEYFPFGFRKNEKNNSVPRIRFEAISVGVYLALYSIDKYEVSTDVSWLDSQMFKVLTRSDASNSKPRVISRIEFVRDNLLGTYVNEDLVGASDD